MFNLLVLCINMSVHSWSGLTYPVHKRSLWRLFCLLLISHFLRCTCGSFTTTITKWSCNTSLKVIVHTYSRMVNLGLTKVDDAVAAKHPVGNVYITMRACYITDVTCSPSITAINVIHRGVRGMVSLFTPMHVFLTVLWKPLYVKTYIELKK